MLANDVERVNVGAAPEQSRRRPALVFERDAGGRDGHQRRCPAGEKHEQTVARGDVARERERPLAGAFAAASGLRMLGGDRLEPIARADWRRRNHQSAAHARSQRRGRGGRHRCCGLADADDPQAPFVVGLACERARDERAGIARTNGCLDDGQEIGANGRRRRGQ
jgi:hypothetical protein